MWSWCNKSPHSGSGWLFCFRSRDFILRKITLLIFLWASFPTIKSKWFQWFIFVTPTIDAFSFAIKAITSCKSTVKLKFIFQRFSCSTTFGLEMTSLNPYKICIFVWMLDKWYGGATDWLYISKFFCDWWSNWTNLPESSHTITKMSGLLNQNQKIKPLALTIWPKCIHCLYPADDG